MLDFDKLCDQMVDVFDSLEAAREDGASDHVRDYANQVKALMKVVTDNVNSIDDIKGHYTSLGLVDMEFKMIQSGVEQLLVAEAKDLYGAAHAGAQMLSSGIMGDLDDVIVQEKTLRDTLKTGTPAWASRSITNSVTGSEYPLADAQKIQSILRDTKRISFV